MRALLALAILILGFLEPAYAQDSGILRTGGADATARADAATAQTTADAQRVWIGNWIMDGAMSVGACIDTEASASAACTSTNNVAIPSIGAHTLREFICVADAATIVSGAYTMSLNTVSDTGSLTSRATLTVNYEAGKTDKLVTSGAISVSIPSTASSYVIKMDSETASTNDFELSCGALLDL